MIGRWGLYLCFLVMLTCAVGAHAGPLAPENATSSYDELKLRCAIEYICPLQPDVWHSLAKAVTGAASDEYMLGIYLITGDNVGRDSAGGMAWFVLAAKQGYARAGLELNRQRRGGADMQQVDEPAIAAAMRVAADKGDTDAMRVLAVLYLDGRGVERNPVEAQRLLRRASDAGSNEAEADMALLLLMGGPGVPADRDDAMRWLARSGQHGNTDAMLTLSHVLTDTVSGAKSQPLESYRWLLRAALLDSPEAQSRLAQLFVRGMNADGGPAKPDPSSLPSRTMAPSDMPEVQKLMAMNPALREKMQGMLTPRAAPAIIVAPDLIAADKWFLLAARNVWYDNSAIRAEIEPHMTSVELAQAHQQVATWHKLTLPEVLALDITTPN